MLLSTRVTSIWKVHIEKFAKLEINSVLKNIILQPT